MRHGEDVELTLGLLRSAWSTRYHRSAVVHTIAPETIRTALLTCERWQWSSYIHLLSGFIQLDGTVVIGRIYNGGAPLVGDWHAATPQVTDECEKSSQTKKPSHILRESAMGRLFLLLNLVCNATSNLFLHCTVYAQIRSVFLKSRNVPLGLVAVLLLSGFQTLLFVANIEPSGDQEEQQADKSTYIARDGEFMRVNRVAETAVAGETVLKLHTFHERKARLRWRLQYGGLAVMFHAGVFVWLSILAIFTLRSQ
jgi:hypothetical protein